MLVTPHQFDNLSLNKILYQINSIYLIKKKYRISSYFRIFEMQKNEKIWEKITFYGVSLLESQLLATEAGQKMDQV